MKKLTLPLLFAVALSVSSVSNVYGQDHKQLISNYISQNSIRDYKKADLNDLAIDVVDHSTSMQGDIIKFQQLYKGLPVMNSVGSALVKDGKVVYFNDTFVKNYGVATSNIPSVTVAKALGTVAAQLNNPAINNFEVLKPLDADLEDKKFVKQNLVYVNHENNLKLAYQIAFQDPSSPSYWNFLVDANSGSVLFKEDLNLSCNFYHDAYSHDHSEHQKLEGPLLGSAEQSSFNLLVPDPATYNVFAFPIEAPTFGARTIVSNPWILASSPEGWHFDGTTHYTYSRGNNAYAYDDIAGNNQVATFAQGGATRNFDFPFSINGTPASNLNASITNLFYANNMVHDVFHKFGFNEASKNFQQTNFGLGGVGNDYVLAEAQDGGGTNNANFSTPADGSKPRMQMYLWSQTNRIFYYNAPSAAVSRQPLAGVAQFGPALTATGTTGDVKLSSVLEGCTAIPAGSLTGKIGLIQRGNCDFVVKVKNAQNAGAIAAIVYNAPTSAAIGNMGGTDATITIPSVLIDNVEGEYIKSHLSANTTVNVTLKNDPAAAITPDGSFDNGIIIHEYGHGISNRLTGNGSTCLSSSVSKEQMGEGWSDFFALMLTNKPGDNASVPRGMATYAAGEGNSGEGIRPAKYSPNTTINAFTYNDTNGMEYTNANLQLVPDVHSIGFVWATMLWDLHWKYVEKYGYSSNVTANTTSGSARVLQLITNALKLQPCNPNFVSGRDAILAAEMATTQGADRCMIWNVFAARGLGLIADAGSPTDINDQFADFSVPVECVLSTSEVKDVKANAISIYPNPAKNEFFINFPKNTMGKVNVEIFDMSGKMVASEYKVSADEKKAINTSTLINGTYIVKVKGLGIDTSSKLLIKK
ncbi:MULTISPECIES: T9SS-dependent M36 family metallopeptidase [unclassified Chryseobacterium]|uniref:T9SS-dependent M36 family metallopeptidase n=1 Tax=unclassified Chryseobacterium TaxID=2593645 RepID=UPI001E4F910B|nr:MULTISPECIES: T9SS-dependent M36 family metallopeptidase [unclassified Chryseobacterium]